MGIPSRKQVAQAGAVLASTEATEVEIKQAMQTLSQWRGLHSQVLNTFQSSLRQSCAKLNLRDITIAQRLKRTPSIITKLRRFPDMNLARMQDIGGLRVVVPKVVDVLRLHEYLLSRTRRYEAVLPPKDYIAVPKSDGYRSLHQVFKNSEGLRVELQIRTKLQHYWATAVEVLGLLERTSFKTGKGSADYRRFFLLCSALFANKESSNLPDTVAELEISDIKSETIQLINDLDILNKLSSVSIAAKQIHTSGKSADYYVMTLDVERKETSLVPFTIAQFEQAKALYLSQEELLRSSLSDVVLVSAGDLKSVRRAYPNYFLDTKRFVNELSVILGD